MLFKLIYTGHIGILNAYTSDCLMFLHTEPIIMSPRVVELSNNARLTSVAYSTSGLSREQRGLGRLKLAQR